MLYDLRKSLGKALRSLSEDDSLGAGFKYLSVDVRIFEPGSIGLLPARFTLCPDERWNCIEETF